MYTTRKTETGKLLAYYHELGGLYLERLHRHDHTGAREVYERRGRVRRAILERGER